MVRSQIACRGVTDPRTLAAMREVDRAEFVPEQMRSRAYDDCPLPIGSGQTISQPYIVALMTSELELTGAERVLEGKMAALGTVPLSGPRVRTTRRRRS